MKAKALSRRRWQDPQAQNRKRTSGCGECEIVWRCWMEILNLPAVPARAQKSRSGFQPMSEAKIRVILADDHELVLQGLKGLLEQQPDMEVLAIARDGG